MSITSRDYVSATNPDCKAKQYTITIDGGYEASVITYGAVITDLIVPDKDGKPTDIMLGCKGLDEYMGNGANHGAVIGRSANRIKDASLRSFPKKRQMRSSSTQRSQAFPDVTAVPYSSATRAPTELQVSPETLIQRFFTAGSKTRHSLSFTAERQTRILFSLPQTTLTSTSAARTPKVL